MCTSCRVVHVLEATRSAYRCVLKVSVASRQQQALYCERCERTFSASKGSSQYVDLTPLSGFEGKVYKQTNWGGTTLFECGCCRTDVAVLVALGLALCEDKIRLAVQDPHHELHL